MKTRKSKIHCGGMLAILVLSLVLMLFIIELTSTAGAHKPFHLFSSRSQRNQPDAYEGTLYYNENDHELYIHNDTDWQPLISYDHAGVPAGVIVMWNGSIANIPNGWALCDGTNGTPNLTSTFIRGSSSPGATGGSSTHTHSAGSYTASSHTHTFSGTTDEATKRGEWAGDAGDIPSGDHVHSFSGTAGIGAGGTISGTSGEASSLPPYFELAFIMRLPS